MGTINIKRASLEYNDYNELTVKYGKAEELLAAIQPNDKKVTIWYFQSETLPKLPDTVVYLTIFKGNDNLKKIEGYPKNLKSFSLYDDTIDFFSQVPSLPPTIMAVHLLIGSQPLIHMEIERKQEMYTFEPTLHCKNCYFVAIEKVIQPTDKHVTIEAFQEPVFSRLPNTVRSLHIHNNLPNTVYNLPNHLLDFICDNNNITSLPKLPKTLDYLNCSENPLSRLPELPPKLTRLYCSHCELTELPKLPDSLIEIECNENKLTSLPPFPPKLTKIMASENQLTRLPKMRKFTLEDAEEGVDMDFGENPLREPFKTFYKEFIEAEDQDANINNNDFNNLNIDPIIVATLNNLNTLANKIDAYDAITSGMGSRQANLKQRAKQIYRLQKTLEKQGPLPPELIGEVGSFSSGVGSVEGPRSLAQQFTALSQRIPELQPVGITQQPLLSEWQRQKQNSNTRRRLRKLMREEKNIKRATGKGGKRKTMRLRRKN